MLLIMLDLKRPRNRQSGFTLIEIALVVIIMGVLMIPLVQAYSTYIQQKNVTVTKTNLDQSASEISKYFSYMAAYPAPASLTASPGSATYGRSITAADIAALAPGVCTLDGGVCMVSGQRNADGTGGLDTVLIGAVPIRTIRGATRSPVTNNVELDGWNNKLTYAVSTNLVSATTYDNALGVIGAIDENYQKTAGIDDDAHFVVISHGPNGSGAYTNSGGQYANCGSIIFDGTNWITAGVENHNCNSDGLFMQGLQVNRGGTGLFNDDRVVIGKAQDLSLWDYTLDAQRTIYNKNTGNVGVKTTTPSEKLHVAGTLKAKTVISTGANADTGVLAGEICQSDGSGCVNISTITGTAGVQCPTGQVLRRLSNLDLYATSPATFYAANCVTPTFPQLNPTNCSGGWVHGIKTNGDVICYP